MARRIFHTFHYKADNQRVQKIRNMGVVSGQKLLSTNDWEKVKSKGDAAVKRWIAEQMTGRSCAVVLIGEKTAGRKWVKHEIKQAWDGGKAVLGIHIHGLTDLAGNQAKKGRNPLDDFTVGGKTLSSIARTYDPPRTTSSGVYAYIEANIEDWIEKAIDIRKAYA